MRDPVHDGVRDDRIGEEPRPIGDCPVGGENDAPGPEAAVDDRVKTLGGGLVDGFQSEVVHDEEIHLEQTLQDDRETILEICRGHVGKELVGAVVGDGEHQTACSMGDRFSEMRLAGAGGPQENDPFAPFDEAAGGEALDEFGVDRGIE